MLAMKKEPVEEYSGEEAQRRMDELVRRAFALPHKPLKQMVGTTPRAQAAAQRKAARGSPRSK
jgi:hypothetical protein